MKNRTSVPLSLLRLVLVLFVLVGLATAQNQEISTVNTSRYTGGGRWDWRVFIKASPEVVRNIRCVEYKLFLRPILSRTERSVTLLIGINLSFSKAMVGEPLIYPSE